MMWIHSSRFRATALSLTAVLALGHHSGACAADNRVEPVRVTAVAHFDFNAASLREDVKPALLAEVGNMQNVTWQSVTTIGHTDSRGSARYNERLANRRARAVKAYLVGKGLDGSMIRTRAEAAAVPVADNTTSDGRARNRRAEVVFEGIRAP